MTAASPAIAPPVLTILRGAMRVPVLAVCGIAFFANIMGGLLASSFSLHASDLGASVALVGLLSALVGLSALVTSIPIGIAADRIGRRPVLRIGATAYTLAMVSFALAPSAGWLAPGRVLVGIGLVALLWIAGVSLGDLTAPHERGVCFGLFTTFMGIGYGIGPWVGGIVASASGQRAAFLAVAVAGLVALALVQFVLRPPLLDRPARTTASHGVGAILQTARKRPVMVAAIANLAISFSFYAVILTFLPLRARELGLTDGEIGTLVTARALASTAVRLPMGALTGRIGARRTLLVALVAEATVTAGFFFATSNQGLLLLIALEGITFAGFLTGSQAYLVATTDFEHRGSAVGITTTVGGLGNALAPLFLGIAADSLGLRVVFPLGAIGMALAIGVILWLWQGTLRDDPAPSTGP